MHNYTSHYSVMVEIENDEGQSHHVILSEGVPAIKTVKTEKPDYFVFTIDDPEIKMVTIQLTTIHGDPDLFVSTTNQKPDRYDHEMRSTNQGLYPD